MAGALVELLDPLCNHMLILQWFTSALLSPVTNTEDLSASLKTPERIEFENTIEGLQEETEEEQWEHNMSMSLSRDGDLKVEMLYEEEEEEDSDDSDLEYV